MGQNGRLVVRSASHFGDLDDWIRRLIQPHQVRATVGIGHDESDRETGDLRGSWYSIAGAWLAPPAVGRRTRATARVAPANSG